MCRVCDFTGVLVVLSFVPISIPPPPSIQVNSGEPQESFPVFYISSCYVEPKSDVHRMNLKRYQTLPTVEILVVCQGLFILQRSEMSSTFWRLEIQMFEMSCWFVQAKAAGQSQLWNKTLQGFIREESSISVYVSEYFYLAFRSGLTTQWTFSWTRCYRLATSECFCRHDICTISSLGNQPDSATGFIHLPSKYSAPLTEKTATRASV